MLKQQEKYQQLPDCIVEAVIATAKQNSTNKSFKVPFSLDVVHSHFKNYNVLAEIMQAKKARKESKYNTQTHIIYLNLVKELNELGHVIINGVAYEDTNRYKSLVEINLKKLPN